MNVIGNALTELYRIFDILNKDKFDGDLEQPVITIQKTKGNVLGHFTVDKVWREKGEDGFDEETGFYEINIDPRWFNSRTAKDIVETLLHEMVHYANRISEIKDCNGNVHNKKFKSTAESIGLIVEKAKGIGWGVTSLSEELSDYIDEYVNPNEEAFDYFRAGTLPKPKKKRTKTLFKYTCPCCGQVAKGKKDIAIKCGNCDALFEMEDVEEDNNDSEDN